jgi:hypothetical protein
VLVMTVTVVVSMSIILWSNVLHLVHTTALRAALDRAFAGGSEPNDNVRVDGVSGAANVLLVTEGLDSDGVLECSCVAVRSRSRRRDRVTSTEVCTTYPFGKRPMASCRRHRFPASFREFRDARDRWPARDRWGWYRAYHPEAGGRARS